MKILVTNDDGITSPGLQALAQAMKKLGDVWVVAPERPQNAVGHAMTLHKPLRLHGIKKQVFAVNGTPTDCVTIGVAQLLRHEPPRLVISGINQGLNLGDDVINSGTVSAALEGTALGIPSIAISQDGAQVFRFKVAAAYAEQVATMVLRYGLPDETLLNVNVPDCPKNAITEVTFTSLSRRRYKDQIIEKVDPRGRNYYWIAGERVAWERKKGSDCEAVGQGKVSITPLCLDMTQYGALKTLRSWEVRLNDNHSRMREGRKKRLQAPQKKRR